MPPYKWDTYITKMKNKRRAKKEKTFYWSLSRRKTGKTDSLTTTISYVKMNQQRDQKIPFLTILQS